MIYKINSGYISLENSQLLDMIKKLDTMDLV